MVIRLPSHHRWLDGSLSRQLRYKAPSLTPHEATSTQQATNPVTGRPAPFYTFIPILCPSPPPPLYLLSTLLSSPQSEVLRLTASPAQDEAPSATCRHTPQAARMSPLTLVVWNVRSILDNPSSNGPEQRTALVARELVDIVSLRERRFSEQGQLAEVGAGYTFLWSGRRNVELAQRLANPPVTAAAASTADESAIVDNRLSQLMDLVQSTAPAVLGHARGERQDWFHDNNAAISNLPAQKNRLHKTYVNRPADDNKTALYRSRLLLHRQMREMQDAWTVCKAEEMEGYANSNKWKNFAAIKDVYGPRARSTAPLLSGDGTTILTEKTQILKRWAEHFRGVLNRPSTISDAAIVRLPEGLAVALQRESTGSDAIPAEIYKQGGPQSMDHLPTLFQEMWRQGEISQDFKDGTVVYLFKRERDRQLCDSCHTNSLMNIAGKMFDRILLNRLNNHLEQGFLPKGKYGFRRYCGTIHINFATRQL
ncbi:hypothetical protein SprV_0802502400 [Sparganum proliferum]